MLLPLLVDLVMRLRLFARLCFYFSAACFSKTDKTVIILQFYLEQVILKIFVILIVKDFCFFMFLKNKKLKTACFYGSKIMVIILYYEIPKVFEMWVLQGYIYKIQVHTESVLKDCNIWMFPDFVVDETKNKCF